MRGRIREAGCSGFFGRATEENRDSVHGEQKAMSNYLSSKYGWTLSIPKGFRVAEDEKGRLVKFVGSEPARLLFVYWEPAGKEAVDETECLRLRSRLVWAYYDEDVIEESMTSAREAVFRAGRQSRYRVSGRMRSIS